MSELILVRHSHPEIIPTVPASQWLLSDEGRQRCRPLADRLALHRPDVIVTSLEPKAVETGQIVAHRLGKPFGSADGLHEHDRSEVTFGSKERFEAKVAHFFAQPEQPVFGRETADQAHQRFAQAVTSVIRTHPHKNVAVVTHGTVMTLFVSRAVGLEPFPFWKRLGLPAFAVLSLPGFDLVTVVEDVENED